MDAALIVTNLAGGGAEKAMVRLAQALGARGHRVRLILLEHRIEHALPEGLSVHALTKPGEAIGSGLLGKLRAAWRLRRMFRRLGLGRDSLVVSTLPFADEVVLLAGLPNVWFRIANNLSAEVARLRQRDPRKAARRLARYRRMYEGRQLVAVSDGVAEDLRDGLGLHHARIERIYNGFDFAAIRELASLPDSDRPRQPYLLHIGRFEPQKRHDLLLDAYARSGLTQPLALLTHDRAALAELIAQKGLTGRAIPAGFRPNPYPWIAGAELLLLASDREGLPNVLIEALACGTRVVSTDCPSGPREVLRGDLERWLVPCEDAAALAGAMITALAEPRPLPDAVPAVFSAAAMAAAYQALVEVR